jgi:glycosyltransferase involved in cell wall biosynthesis
MTRRVRTRTSAGSVRLASLDGETVGALARRHVAVVGADASPHVTGFPHFTSKLLRLLEERSAAVSLPLQGPIPGTPDLVVAVLPGPGAAGAAVELANRHDAPLLVMIQGESTPPAEDARTIGARLAAKLEGTALRRADRWGVTGEAARQRLRRLGVADSRIEAMPYWMETSRPGPISEGERDVARRSLGWPAGFLVVCPVGADTFGLAAVVQAAAELEVRGSDVRLMVVGRGARLRALKASVGSLPNVTVSELDDDGYPAALAAADLLLLSEPPDRPDAAMAGRMAAGLGAGRPLIAAVGAAADGHLGGELARSEGAIVTVPPDRPRQLADTIEVLRGAPQARAVMAAGARHYTRACLGSVAAAATLEAIAARTMNRAGGSSWWGRAR